MISYLYVTKSPFFTQAGKNKALIKNLPLGNYQLQLWHPGLKTPLPTKDITISKNKNHTSIILKKLPKTVIQPTAMDMDFDEGGY